MAQDIRKLFKEDNSLQNEIMPKGHEARFLDKLNETLPQQPRSRFKLWQIAASVVLMLGLGYGAYNHFNKEVIPDDNQIVTTEESQELKTLGDISPDFKKVEDYYLAAINTELSKMTFTPENKELFDGYIERLEELNDEYDKLSLELTQSGPSESTVDALINNLKLRLNLMYRLKEKLNELNSKNQNLNAIEA